MISLQMNNLRLSSGVSRVQLTTRHTVCRPSGLRRALITAALVDDKSSDPPSEAQSSDNIVKKAWDELNQKSMSFSSVLGQSNVARLEAQLGKKKIDQIAGGKCCSMRLKHCHAAWELPVYVP